MSTHPVVLVTGAAQRIGRAIALELAHHGYDVAVHCHRSVAAAHETAAAAQRAGVRAQVFQADLSDENQCRGLAADVQRHFERLDAVVNNASLFEYDAPANFTVAAMERHWRANTAPAILLSQALHGQALASGRVGVVVNLLDQKLWNPNPDYFSYTLSKAALQTATVLLAQALAPSLRVCGVAPGITLASGPMSDEQFSAAHRMTPLARSSTPDDVARAVRFLIESPAITGSTLLVDGGQHLEGQPRDVLYLAAKV